MTEQRTNYLKDKLDKYNILLTQKEEGLQNELAILAEMNEIIVLVNEQMKKIEEHKELNKEFMEGLSKAISSRLFQKDRQCIETIMNMTTDAEELRDVIFNLTPEYKADIYGNKMYAGTVSMQGYNAIELEKKYIRVKSRLQTGKALTSFKGKLEFNKNQSAIEVTNLNQKNLKELSELLMKV